MFYCKNCGEAYAVEQAEMCEACHTPRGHGSNYCSHCGFLVTSSSKYCQNCGIPFETLTLSTTTGKSRALAGVLAILVGGLGVHNFYLGYNQKAIIQLIMFIIGVLTTCLIIGLFIMSAASIWGLVEGIMIFTGKINTDGNGNLLTD